MDVIVKLLGGYNSWQYTTVAIGLVLAGGGLTVWKAYFMPISVMGQVMLIALINNQVSVDNIQGAAGGMTSTIPIVFAVVCVLSDFKMLERYFPAKEKEETDKEKSDDKPTEILEAPEEKPAENPQKPPEITGAFDKFQFNKKR